MSRVPLLSFLDYQTIRIHIEPDKTFDAEKPQRAQISSTFAIQRSEEHKQLFGTLLTVKLYKQDPDENASYTVEVTIEGQFFSNVRLTEKGVPAAVVLNAITMLYGVARGIVGQATAGGPHGRFVLPAVMFDDLVASSTQNQGSLIITDAAHTEAIAAIAEAEKESSSSSPAVESREK